MFEKEIIFSAPKEYLDQNVALPEPIKLHIPKWFKDLKHNVGIPTMKGCMPILDSLTSGYLIKMPQDMLIQHNVTNNDGNKDSFVKWGYESLGQWVIDQGLNLNFDNRETHAPFQVGECPHLKKNKDLPFYKIMNPWLIQTPPGYSCLFLPPMNNPDDRFQIIPGIVDTDKYNLHINFPIILNGDKYPEMITTIKVDTPVAQVIPFKRDAWKMKVQVAKEDPRWTGFKLKQKLMHAYKTVFWSKKSWK
jgi:hypothetical protein